MRNSHRYRRRALRNDRVAQSQFTHGVERSVQPFTNILVWRIGKLIDHTNHPLISRKLRMQNVGCSHVTSQPTRTFHFDSIVEYADLDIRRKTVVAV